MIERPFLVMERPSIVMGRPFIVIELPSVVVSWPFLVIKWPSLVIRATSSSSRVALHRDWGAFVYRIGRLRPPNLALRRCIGAG